MLSRGVFEYEFRVILIHSLKIKGDPADEAVLCTNDKTYAVREVQQSNSVLLISLEEDNNLLIRDNVSSTLELIPTRPRLQVLDTLLRHSEYDGLDSTMEVERRLYTIEELVQLVQASDIELLNGLDERRAVDIDGYYRILSSEYVMSLLDALTTSLIIEDDLHTPLSVERAADLMNCSDNIAEYILRSFGEKAGQQYTLSIPRYLSYVGMSLLQTRPRESKDAFLQAWQEKVPDIFRHQINLSSLRGQYLLDDKDGNTIIYFPRTSLPSDPPARFQDLFLTREKWEADEMRPFIEDLVPEGQKKKLDAMIIKYVRVQKMPNGKVIWSSRVRFM